MLGEIPEGPLLQTENLSKHFGGVVASDGVNFTLQKYELRCLIGPNGAGKSTFFKMLTGQLKPSRGSIRFRGNPIEGSQSHEIARMGIGIKTQVPNVFYGLTVQENIWLGARRRRGRDASETVRDVLSRLSLTDIAGRLVGQLSHGQRQWVEIGMVIAAGPTLVLLDEPAAGMTDEETARTAEIIREFNRESAVIIVEHDIEFIKMIADKVTVFHRGKILMEDTVENVLQDERVQDVYLGKKVDV